MSFQCHHLQFYVGRVVFPCLDLQVWLCKPGQVVNDREDDNRAKLTFGLSHSAQSGRFVGFTDGHVAVESHEDGQPDRGSLSDRGKGEDVPIDDCEQVVIERLGVGIDVERVEDEWFDEVDWKHRHQEAVVDDRQTLEEEERRRLHFVSSEDAEGKRISEESCLVQTKCRDGVRLLS